MLPHFISNGRKVTALLSNAAAAGDTVDLQDIFFRFTLDSFGSIGFDHPINSLDQQVPFAQAFNRSQATIMRNAFQPHLRFMKDKQFDDDVHLMRSYVQDIIDKRRRQGDYHNRTDLLSQFMTMKDDDGKALPDTYLINMIINFFIAGRDTTACLLSWTFYELAKNPHIEEKLHRVVEHTCGRAANSVAAQLTRNDLSAPRARRVTALVASSASGLSPLCCC
eukprot:TRINITY_DN2085_c0_g1_i6.p1 TRINITY_DN2085_c0_g1~~TRINITY_DN2085_c0_g1_i6.p1  ORF type:complete len:222 (-),score=29.88 TRINITY_DN2085_c0_g1_i6:712-1377(-)